MLRFLVVRRRCAWRETRGEIEPGIPGSASCRGRAVWSGPFPDSCTAPVRWPWLSQPACRQWRGFHAIRCVAEQLVLSPYCKRAYRILCKIVRELRFTILPKGIQILLLVLDMGHSLRQFAARYGFQRIHPPPIRLKQRLCLHLTRRFPNCVTQMCIFSLCGKELAAMVAGLSLWFSY